MMKMKFKKAIALAVTTAIVSAGPLGVIAKAEKPDMEKNKGKVEIQKKEDKIQVISWKDMKEKIKGEKESIEKLKHKIEKERKELKKKIEKGTDKELNEEVLKKIEELNQSMNDIEAQIKQLRLEMREIIKNEYTKEEMDALKETAEKIEKENDDVKAIPVENIVTKKMNVKFDTPPVIKQGRTLIPVRAIVEGFGADVKWNQEEQKVIITKGDIEIVLQLADGKAFVNGEEKAIDVPGQLMNNRTLVPLRFIVENLGLRVDYDEDTQIIDIEETENTTTDGTEVENTATDSTEVVQDENQDSNIKIIEVEDNSETISE